jgi:hypothetical protein
MKPPIMQRDCMDKGKGLWPLKLRKEEAEEGGYYSIKDEELQNMHRLLSHQL